MVVATFLPTNGSAVEHQGHCFGNTLVMKFDPSLRKVPFLVSFEFNPTLTNNQIYANIKKKTLQ